jgi:hypothetical protein
LRTVRYEARLTWLSLTRGAVDKRFIGKKGLLVNVGCGPQGVEGWVNIDSFPAEGVTCVRDCRTRVPLPSGSAKGILTEHFLEHLDYYEQAPRFLADCLRVLEPGGILRVIVPDGAKYLEAYTQPGWEALRSFSPLVVWGRPSLDGSTLREVLPFRTKMEVINFHFRQMGQHQFSYDYETLADLLVGSGFDSVCERRYRESSLPDLAIDSEFRSLESLVVEGKAP